MSNEVLKQVIGRAVADSEYRELLFTDPGKALQGLDLAEDEITALKSITPETFDKAAVELSDRISRAGFTLGRSESLETNLRVHNPIRIIKNQG